MGIQHIKERSEPIIIALESIREDVSAALNDCYNNGNYYGNPEAHGYERALSGLDNATSTLRMLVSMSNGVYWFTGHAEQQDG